MPLYFDNHTPFTTGAASYSYQPVRMNERTNRIIIQVKINGDFRTQAYVDTGAAFIIISPEVADMLQVDPSSGLERQILYWQGSRIEGMLHRVSLTFPAEKGNGLEIDGTAFIPSSGGELLQEFHCILGMQGCFERLRFAIDPANDMFYFGGLSE